MKIGDNSSAKTVQLQTLSQNQNTKSQTATTPQLGNFFASVLNQLLLEVESMASNQSSGNSLTNNTSLLGDFSGNSNGLGSLFTTLGLNSSSLGSILGDDSSESDNTDSLTNTSLLGTNTANTLTGNNLINTNTADSLLANSLSNSNTANALAAYNSSLSNGTSNVSLTNNQPLSFRTISPEQVNSVLGGKLTGMGQAFIQAGKLYNIDPALLTAISQHETGNGKSQAANLKNNVAGIMGSNGLKSYPSVEACIMDMARNLSKNYLGQGLTSISKIGAKYAPIGAENDPTGLNNYWVNGVNHYYNQLRV